MKNTYELSRMLENKKFGENISISKRKMRRLPSWCSETILGDLGGAQRQYRGDQNIHILEYPDRYEVHKDRVDPRKDPIGHILNDSPETLASLGIACTSGTIVGRTIYNNRKTTSRNATFEAVIGGILTAVLTGVGTYYLGKILRSW